MAFDLQKYAEEANKVWNNKYEYVDYIPGYRDKNGKKIPTSVGIMCHEKDQYGREHGIFWKTPTKHRIGKQGCPKCAGRFRMDTEYLVETSKLCHKSKFDNLSYEKTEFKDYSAKVIVTCKNKNEDGTEHGDFQITPHHLLSGQGCPICRYLKASATKTYSFEETVAEMLKVHPHLDFSKSKETYVNRGKWMLATCHKLDKNGKEHGDFWLIPRNVINPYLHNGCPKCGREKTINAHKYSNEDFIEKARKRHGDKYDYSKTDILNRDEEGKVIIICPKHGEFKQTPSNHLFGQGCPICKESKLEAEIRVFLNEKGEDIELQKSFDWLGRQTLDFYLPKYNVAIECQGKQHFLEDAGWSENGENLELITERDERKRKLCEENGIKLLYYSNLGIDYPYHVFEDKEELLKEIFNTETLK